MEKLSAFWWQSGSLFLDRNVHRRSRDPNVRKPKVLESGQRYYEKANIGNCDPV